MENNEIPWLDQLLPKVFHKCSVELLNTRGDNPRKIFSYTSKEDAKVHGSLILPLWCVDDILALCQNTMPKVGTVKRYAYEISAMTNTKHPDLLFLQLTTNHFFTRKEIRFNITVDKQEFIEAHNNP